MLAPRAHTVTKMPEHQHEPRSFVDNSCLFQPCHIWQLQESVGPRCRLTLRVKVVLVSLPKTIRVKRWSSAIRDQVLPKKSRIAFVQPFPLPRSRVCWLTWYRSSKFFLSYSVPHRRRRHCWQHRHANVDFLSSSYAHRRATDQRFVEMDTHWQDNPITAHELAAAPLPSSLVDSVPFRSVLVSSVLIGPHQPPHRPVEAGKTNRWVKAVVFPNKPLAWQGLDREGGGRDSKGKKRFNIPKVPWLCLSRHLVRNNELQPFQNVLPVAALYGESGNWRSQ